MAPSARTPDAGAACLAALDEIERRWRDALSLVHAGDAARAQRDVEAAGDLLARLGELEELRRRIDPPRLAELAERMTRLSALHHELSVQSRRAQEEVERALASARQGKTALAAYGGQSPHFHACDEVG
jgi:hypothetical protein